jgi:MarR family transcriptional regulator, transcriptional regulator for hemolysin
MIEFSGGIQQTMRTNLEDDFLILLYDVARHMRTYADQIASMHGMTRAQWIILARLERQPDLSQNELAALAEVAPITASRLVDRLEELGLVKRCADPEDRRIWRLQPTPEAAPILRNIERFRVELHELMTKEIDPWFLDAMVIGLHQMKKNLSSSGRAAEASA